MAGPPLMLWLYRLLFLPALVIIAPAYLRRMRRRGGYSKGFGQRFGQHPKLPPKRPGRPRVWLQAVSVGEMLAIGPILEALKHDGVEVYLTTTTSTGHRIARDRYLGLTVGMGYFPIDWWPFITRAWRRISPDMIVLTEGERWPEILHQATIRGVPVISVNARLSDRSFVRLRSWPAACRLMFGGVTRFLPASESEELRFLALGVPGERMTTTGNIKLDVRIPLLDPGAREKLRRQLGLPGGFLLLGSSTWPGEEAALIAVLQHLRAAGLACSLLLVPRHAERRLEVERLLIAAKVRFHFRSHGPAAGEVDVAVGDTTGELRNLTQLADVVFVGKSLPPHTEGQTPVEAAALEKPILFGAGMGNFRVIANDLVTRGAARVVADPAELQATVEELARDDAKRSALAAAAVRWHGENAGAVDRTLAVIREEIARRR